VTPLQRLLVTAIFVAAFVTLLVLRSQPTPAVSAVVPEGTNASTATEDSRRGAGDAAGGVHAGGGGRSDERRHHPGGGGHRCVERGNDERGLNQRGNDERCHHERGGHDGRRDHRRVDDSGRCDHRRIDDSDRCDPGCRKRRPLQRAVGRSDHAGCRHDRRYDDGLTAAALHRSQRQAQDIEGRQDGDQEATLRDWTSH
jgi:hypothetical protein